ncbi:cytoskeleton-associated protein 2-like isoform X2 [Heterodontus francisci]|uniref:cytoskeleton-associated protein 2-like isoform X2 n=1 Tax=Heterodontus francisci TaxID=7792 RepID=UPI00355ADEF0
MGKPLQATSYAEQRRQKLEDYIQRRKFANNVAIQARSRLENRVYLKDETNLEKLQVSKWQTEATVCGEGKIESNKTIQNKPVQKRNISQSSTQSESNLLMQREKPSVENTCSATSETKMPAEQISQSEKLPSSAQENNLKAEQKSKGNTSVATNKTKNPAQQGIQSEKLPFGQKNNSDVEQKAKFKSQPKVQKVTLSQSFLSAKNERAKLMIADKSNRPKPPHSTFKKPVLGSFRGKIVESKIQSFRSSSQQKEKKQEKSDLVTSASVPETHNKESRGILHRPRPKGVENMHPVRRTLNVTSHSKPKRLTTATGLSTALSQKQLVTDVLNIKIDFKQSAHGDTAIVATQTISTKKTAVPFQNASKAVPARRPGWKVSKVRGNHKPMKHKESAEEKRTQLTQWTESKEKLVKRPAMTPLQRKKVVEEPVKSLWTTIVEEENQSELVNKINQTLSECLKWINEGCPSEDCLQTLQTFIESVPKAKKFARYWICLAQLEQRKGSVHDVMTIYEQAIKIGAQPAEELRNTLADILRNTKTPKKLVVDGINKTEDDGAQKDPKLEMYCMTEQKDPEEKGVDFADNEQKPSIEENVYCTNDKQDLPLEGQEMCIAATDEHTVSSENEGDPLANEQQISFDEQKLYKQQEMEPTTGDAANDANSKEGCEAETKENYVEADYKIKDIKIEDMKTPVKHIMTPSKIVNKGSSVKYSVKTTPNFQCAKNAVQMEKSNSAIKDVKFLTPVRRSRRIEQVSSQLPLMLQDHDPCVSSLEDLKNLGEGSTAYTFRVNSALQE